MQSLDLAALRTHSWHIQACSAQTGQGISEGFEWLIEDVGFRLYGAPTTLGKPALSSETARQEETGLS